MDSIDLELIKKTIGSNKEKNLKSIVFKNGTVYEGGWKDGMKHGRGELLFGNGEKYEGEFEDNYYSGQGNLWMKNGDSYMGQFSMGMANGKGLYINKFGN